MPNAIAWWSEWTYERPEREKAGSHSPMSDQVPPPSCDRAAANMPPMKTVFGSSGSTAIAWLYWACCWRRSRSCCTSIGLSGARLEFTASETKLLPPSSERYRSFWNALPFSKPAASRKTREVWPETVVLGATARVARKISGASPAGSPARTSVQGGPPPLERQGASVPCPGVPGTVSMRWPEASHVPGPAQTTDHIEAEVVAL